MNRRHPLFALTVSVGLSIGLSACDLWDSSTRTPEPAPETAPTTYTIGGEISGLASGQQVTLEYGVNTVTLSANGSFTFENPIEADASYNVIVSEQPAIQTCTVSSGSGNNVSGNVTSVRVSCTSRNVYVTDASNSQIFQYLIKRDGTLEPLSPAVVTTASPPQGIAIGESGKYLYATLNGSNQVAQFNIGNDGSLMPMANPTVATGPGPYQAVVSPNGKYLFVGNQGGVSVTSFGIASDGSLTAIGTYGCSTSCTNVQGLAVDPTTSRLYIGGAAYNQIVTMTIGSDGSLSNPESISSGIGTGNRAIAVDPTGSYLLAAANYAMNPSIKVFTISSTDGSLSLYSSVPLADSGVETMVFDPDGSYLYLGMGTNDTVNQLSYASGTPEALTPPSISAGASQTNVYGVAVDPTGSYVYTVNRSSKDISAFVAGSGGLLSLNPVSSAVPIPGSPDPDPLSIAVR